MHTQRSVAPSRKVQNTYERRLVPLLLGKFSKGNLIIGEPSRGCVEYKHLDTTARDTCGR